MTTRNSLLCSTMKLWGRSRAGCSHQCGGHLRLRRQSSVNITERGRSNFTRKPFHDTDTTGRGQKPLLTIGISVSLQRRKSGTSMNGRSRCTGKRCSRSRGKLPMERESIGTDANDPCGLGGLRSNAIVIMDELRGEAVSLIVYLIPPIRPASFPSFFLLPKWPAT